MLLRKRRCRRCEIIINLPKSQIINTIITSHNAIEPALQFRYIFIRPNCMGLRTFIVLCLLGSSLRSSFSSCGITVSFIVSRGQMIIYFWVFLNSMMPLVSDLLYLGNDCTNDVYYWGVGGIP